VNGKMEISIELSRLCQLESRRDIVAHSKRSPITTIIETRRLVLRKLELDDAQALHPVFSDPEGTRFTLRVHSTVDETMKWIEAIRRGYEKHGFAPWAVTRKRDNGLIGYCGCGFILLDGKKEREVGYRISRSCWGQGFATEAVRATIRYTFERLSFINLVALIQPDNIASIRVAEKAGMKHQYDTVYEGQSMRLYEVKSKQST